jgi:hypothetical protein
MSFNLINRRTHLYLGLFLLPWLTMYGVSSFIVIHKTWFQKDRGPTWEPLFEKAYSRPISDKVDLRTSAQEILKDCGLEGAFWAKRLDPNTLLVNRFTFWGSTRLTYDMGKQTLRAERERRPVSQGIVEIHFRGGFRQRGFWNNFWGVLVDVVCVAIVTWVISGLIMWWNLPRLRIWGAVAVVSGLTLFSILVTTL